MVARLATDNAGLLVTIKSTVSGDLEIGILATLETEQDWFYKPVSLELVKMSTGLKEDVEPVEPVATM